MKRIIGITVAFLLATGMKAQSARIAIQGFEGFATEMNQSTSSFGDHFSVQVQMTPTSQGQISNTADVVMSAPAMAPECKSIVVQEEIIAGVVQEELNAGRKGETGRHFYDFILDIPRSVGNFVCELFRAN